MNELSRNLCGWFWQQSDPAPKDGTHILVCYGTFSNGWGFDQSPPQVVHYYPDPDEPGFYPSHGIVQDSYNDRPVNFTWWSYLGPEPVRPVSIHKPMIVPIGNG